MTYGTDTRCTHCDVLIVDPTTRVIHGARTYCCPNCAAAMEQSGSGSDPHTLETASDLRCARCGAVIVDESTMQSHENTPFCCANCAHAGEERAETEQPAEPLAADRPRTLR